MNILNAQQIRDLDSFTIENEPITSIDLMERASLKCFDILDNIFPNSDVVLFCGTGNNGGDGLVISRLLLENDQNVRTYIIGDPQKGSVDFKINYERLKNLSQSKIFHINDNEKDIIIYNEEVVIDAIFGSGINAEITDWRSEVIDKINFYNNTLVSIDIPSGMMPDLIDPQIGSIIKADVTLSFHCPKRAFVFAENEIYCGDVIILDIGLMDYFYPVETNFEYLIREELTHSFHSRELFSHKGTFGHGLLIGGTFGKIGAIVLSSKAALRSGIGLLTAHIPKCGYDIFQTSIPEAMCILDSQKKYLSSADEYPEVQAMGIGPGMGTRKNTVEFLSFLLDQTFCPLVLDADALNIIALKKELLNDLPYETILTPHPKEFDRLFGVHSSSFERMKTMQIKSIELNIIIVLKGAFTRISVPDGQIFINSTGNPGMATAGAGDVLTGIITSFLAQGYPPEEASKLGVYIHGLAGDLAEENIGMTGMISSDIINFIPQAINLLETASY